MKNKYFEVLSGIDKTTPYYSIYLDWDYNDGDCISKTLDYGKAYFESNETLQLVLCYISKRRGKLFGDDWNSTHYGNLVINSEIKGLLDFMYDEELTISFKGELCHSVCRVEITYYDENNIPHYVELTNFDDLYTTKEEAIKDLEDRLEEYEGMHF